MRPLLADRAHGAFHLVREICREIAVSIDDAPGADATDRKIARRIASANTEAAIERLARSDPRLAATVDQWDADPWLLNTPKGVIDLRTGKRRSHRPGDYMTHMTAVAPASGTDCPTWVGFLERITDGDKALQRFLARKAGYMLTGRTTAHVMFFAYGTGANGKSVYVSTISGIVGDYHRTAPIETFTDSAIDRHPTDLAGLRGARFVTAVETEEGRRWAESKIKALTGGDKIAARFMRQDFFEFTPQFKLMIAGNHKPGLRSVDEAIRRRFNLIPFTVTIPPDERDENLTEKLKAEWPGILSWMINGCIDWQKHGLDAPDAVTAATAAYLEAEDAIAAWLDECCARELNAWAGSSALFASWSAWADRSGERAGTIRVFTQKLEDRGFEPHRRNDGRGFNGLRILPASGAADRSY